MPDYRLGREQRTIVRKIKTIGQQVGATPKEIKAALETGLVESGLRNLPGGDADSAGWRQERASIYKDPTNLDASIHRFFKETAAVRDKYGRAGDLAAAVQRPAAQYRGRYQGVAGQAQGLLGAVTPAAASTPAARAASTTTTTTTPGVDNSAARGQAVMSFLNQHGADPLQFALGMRALQDTPGTTSTHSSTAPSAPQASTSTSGHADFSTPPTESGVVNFEGKQVAAWIAPALHYARQHGWKGTVTSGFRSFADQTRIYNSGVRPAAKPGTSNHEGTTFPRGAIDASDAQTLSNILLRSPYAKRLVFAGAKDPVHFSHPHNGSY